MTLEAAKMWIRRIDDDDAIIASQDGVKFWIEVDKIDAIPNTWMYIKQLETEDDCREYVISQRL